jgi:hypothetical protein
MSWFDKIGVTYAQNYDEVEAARSLFEQQRETVLDRLMSAAKEALNGKGLAIDGEASNQGGFVDIFVAKRWTSVREKGPRQSGISFGLGMDSCFAQHGGGRFGFGAYVFLRMGEPRFKRLRPALEAVTVNTQRVDYSPGKDRSACVRTAWIRPGDAAFTLDGFIDAAVNLPDVFVKIDEYVAAAYQKNKSA